MYWRQAAVASIAAALLVGLGACSPSPEPSRVPASPLPFTETSIPSLTSTDTLVLPTPAGVCDLSNGTMETQELTSSYMPAPLRFIVYLPPCYTEQTDLRYPVLYLFHGKFYDENQWVRIGTPGIADRLITSREVPPFLIIMPFDPYPYEPYEYGFDEAFLKDLIPYIDSHYRTLSDRSHRALGGLSRGSSWSIHFGLSRPELFGKFGLHSPVIFTTDGLLVEKWLDIIRPELMPQIYLDVSENDQNIQNAHWLEDILTNRGITHEWHLNTGFHTEEYWAMHVEEYLRWYASGWETVP